MWNSNALCPVRPPQTAIGRPAGTLLGSAPVPVAVSGVAPKTVFPGARIVPIRSAPPDQPALKSFQPSLVMPPAASWDNSRSAGNPQRRQARHICRNRNHQILKLRRSGIVLADGHHDVAPTELDSFAWLVLQRFQSYGLRRHRALRATQIQTLFAPFVHPKLPLAARLGHCWGARPSRWPFSASRQKPFSGVAAGILPAVEPWLPARRKKPSATHTSPNILQRGKTRPSLFGRQGCTPSTSGRDA